MSLLEKKQQVLEVLVENLSNPQPQVVNSELIADKLKMSTKDTCQLLKIMNEMGVVVSDLEGQHALITKEGLNSMTL
jgi:Mn-dependent DtxR family transcriptional regulator